MTVKNAHLGGNDWTNGSILVAVDINDTFNETSGYHRKTNTSLAGSVVFTAGSFGIAGSIVFGTSGGLWTTFKSKVLSESEGGAGNSAVIRFRVSGANMGVQYINPVPGLGASAGSAIALGGNTAGFNHGGGDNVIGSIFFNVNLSEPLVDNNMVIYLEMDDATSTTGIVHSWDMRVEWVEGWINEN